MTCPTRADDTALAWGHTRISEMNFRFITQESPCFSCGECQEILPWEAIVL